MTAAPIGGTVAPGYESVQAVFEKAINGDELGAAYCAYVGGEKVVDLWGGWADEARTREWQHDTIVTTFSAVKGMTATCALHLADRGLLDIDAPVAKYWPEFAQEGKGDVTVRMVLSHQSGLPWSTAPYPREKFLDWPTVTDALARSAPVWPPGSKWEYHGGSFGFLVGTVIERIDGRRLADYFREEIAAPLGADVHIAVAEEDDHRCAQVVGPEDMVGGSNSELWRRAGDGAATGQASAAGLARVYAALADGGQLDGVRILRPETIAAAGEEQALANGDGVTGEFGLGFQRFAVLFPGMNPGVIGHTGMGGYVGLADPKRRLGAGYVMNRMNSGSAAELINTTYYALVALL